METKLLTKPEIQKLYKPLNAKAHKGTQGHALLIGGSYGKMGSIALSAKAALRCGAGLVTAFIPECGYEILQISVPEAMAITDLAHKHISKIEYSIAPNAIGIGPGIGQEPSTQNAFSEFLRQPHPPLVIDADGINMLSLHPQWLGLLQPKTILTPHPKELSRLVGRFDSEEETLEAAIDFARKHKLILVLKGAPTLITDGNSIFKNTTGNAALATAGSGDVLTGIITGLLAQGYGNLEACCLGVYLHGLTADLATQISAKESFIASDIIENLGKAFLECWK